MTISYSGNFCKLLLRWKGSLWKTVWKELSLFLFAYYLVRIVYRRLLPIEYKPAFEQLISEWDEYTTRIPIMFLLGFYVAAVVKRWWEQFEWLSWPDDFMSLLCFLIPGTTEEEVYIRRTVARYLNLTAALSWRDISIRVRKRFPTIDHIMTAGLMTSEERLVYQNFEVNSRWFVPLEWIQSIILDYSSRNTIPAPLMSHLLDLLFRYRSGFRQLHCYDWVCIPLVYTQVAAMATYGYFVLGAVGRQFFEHRDGPGNSFNCTKTHCVDYYIPIFTILEFLFYVGWFKVGQDLMRPFEEDDDDFELNYILDRNIQVCSAMANQNLGELPPKTPGRTGWDRPELSVIPHTRLSAQLRYHPPKLHAYVTIKNTQDAQPAEPILLKSKKRRYF